MGVYLAGNAANQPTSLASGTSITAANNISGQVIYLVSGHNEVQGTFTAQVSGQPVRISGETVIALISGQTVVGNFAANVSGQVIFIGEPGGSDVAAVNALMADNMSNSDDALVTRSNLVGYDGLDGDWKRLRITSSGQGISGIPHRLVVAFSGDVVQMSGQYVQLADGSTPANIITTFTDTFSNTDNGLTVDGRNMGYDQVTDQWKRLRVLASGQGMSGILHRLAVAISGDPVSISGQVVNISGSRIQIAGSGDAGSFAAVYTTSIANDPINNDRGLFTVAFNKGYVDSQSGYVSFRMTASGQGISGVNHKLIVGLSGDPVSISGQPVSVSGNAVRISGSMVSISGQPVSVSGNMVSISGQPVTVSGNAINTSGNVNYNYGTVIRTTSGTIATSLSGGTELGSGITNKFTIRNLSGNAPVYIGGTGSEAPFSGKGMILFGNESQEFEVDNFNRMRVFAVTSGQRVRVIGWAAN